MNQNSLLALVTLIALLWINGGDCLKGRQNENEVLNEKGTAKSSLIAIIFDQFSLIIEHWQSTYDVSQRI